VDDILAARAAKKELEITAIGFLGTPTNRKVMKKAFIRVGADHIIEDPKQLLQLIG
jgi:phosphoglycolate phosphatase-like HAD superfamily hydrolase